MTLAESEVPRAVLPARMVDSWIYGETITILAGPGWPIRVLLLAGQKNVVDHQREASAKDLYSQRFDLQVPGITPLDPRARY